MIYTEAYSQVLQGPLLRGSELGRHPSLSQHLRRAEGTELALLISLSSLEEEWRCAESKQSFHGR